jgi:hypothetical protein
MLVVVFPSPAGVGVIAETNTRRAGAARRRGRRNTSKRIFAMSRPYGIQSSSLSPRLDASSLIDRSADGPFLICPEMRSPA